MAREYAVERRDDVYSPASGSYSLRLLPALLSDMRSRDHGSDEEAGEPVIGALDIKDAFLQVAQERPLQISTSLSCYKVFTNLPGQRIGAKAWYEHIRDCLISNQDCVFCVKIRRSSEGGHAVVSAALYLWN